MFSVFGGIGGCGGSFTNRLICLVLCYYFGYSFLLRAWVLGLMIVLFIVLVFLLLWV